ncbi:MAG: hypothetical protein J6M53_00490 [Bacteroidaceae bacterium]|nr:hypothetical protein [Bacteroidaceae bacterium]
MKKYIAPSIVASRVETGVLMEGSMDIKKGTADDGGWTRQQIWLEEEGE